MPLRNASEVGVRDVRRFSDLQVTNSSQQQLTDRPMRQRRAPKGQAPQAALAAVQSDADRVASPGPPVTPTPQSPSLAATRPLLGDERLVHLQADVPEVVLKRVKDVSFELAEDHPHLSRHQTILGALVWEHVDHRDQRKLDELADLVDDYGKGPWCGQAEERRLSGRMPAGLKRRVEGTVLALEHSQREVAVKLVVAALVWRHVISRYEDQARFARLVDTLGDYHQELSQRSRDAPVASPPPVS